MTRGQIAVITENGVLTSDEFNGNMYPEDGGYGSYVFQALDNINSEAEFREYVKRFNDEFFQYDGRLIFEYDDSYLDMQESYYEKWSSDYVYIKNLTDIPQTLTDAKGRKVRLGSSEKAAFHYGSYHVKSIEDLDKRTAYDELMELRESLSYDMLKNFEDISRICDEYDYKNFDISLGEMLADEGFLWGTELEDMLRSNSVSTARMRYFIAGTYDADIYRLNGYGNLSNVDEADFINIIDQIADALDKSILASVKGMEME